jgi:hypothetical protein
MSRTAPPFKPSFDYPQPTFQSRSTMPPPEFYPRQQHQNCSHIITDSGPQCGLALLNQVSNPPVTKGRNGSSSSTESSSSVHTQPAIGSFGQGQGWIQPSSSASIWGRPELTPHSADFYPRGSKYGKSRASVSTSATSPSDDYHLLSMADGLVEDLGNVNLEPETSESDILFNPSILSPPSKTIPNLDPSALSSHQISALAAAFAAPSRSPQVNQLVTQASRLARGLARPPPNRGFRAKASDMIDRDENNTTVFVGGLSQGVTESILNDIFEPYGSIAYVSHLPFLISCLEVMNRSKSHQGKDVVSFNSSLSKMPNMLSSKCRDLNV